MGFLKTILPVVLPIGILALVASCGTKAHQTNATEEQRHTTSLVKREAERTPLYQSWNYTLYTDADIQDIVGTVNEELFGNPNWQTVGGFGQMVTQPEASGFSLNYAKQGTLAMFMFPVSFSYSQTDMNPLDVVEASTKWCLIWMNTNSEYFDGVYEAMDITGLNALNEEYNFPTFSWFICSDDTFQYGSLGNNNIYSNANVGSFFYEELDANTDGLYTNSYYYRVANINENVELLSSSFEGEIRKSINTWQSNGLLPANVDYGALYNENYAQGYLDGSTAGYNRGYVAGQNAAQDEGAAFGTLFNAIVSVPINLLNGLSPLVIWDTPIVSIIITFLFAGVVLFFIQKALTR